MTFLNYIKEPKYYLDNNIPGFLEESDQNLDKKTVNSFGEEWEKFSEFNENDIKVAGDQYFDIVPESILNSETTVLDLGCGSGRWTKYVSNRVKLVEAVDPSNAVYSAKRLNKNQKNVRVTQAGVSNIPFADNSFDMAVCLGVLHHIPDTKNALYSLTQKIKPKGHLLLYLYYSLDNRGTLYRLLFYMSHFFRLIISNLPKGIKKLICDIIAILVYLPIVVVTRGLIGIFGQKIWIKKLPLYYYHDKSFFIIRNDSLDRFGTPLEQRFSKAQIEQMLKECNYTQIIFSEKEPFWHVFATKNE